MTRYFRIFLLHFQSAFEQRGRSLVWFLYSLIPTGIFLLFWLGAVQVNGGSVSGWTFSTITSYYFLLIIASSMLMAHIEEDVALEDIQQGQLSTYLLKPFSYFWGKFFLEIPWRLIQGSFGIITCLLFIFLFGTFFTFSTNPLVLFISIFIACAAFMMAFIFKMIIGLTALWLTDARGLFQVVEAILVVFGGYVVPVTLLPGFAEQIAKILPFSYMAYYPIVAFQGQLSIVELMQVFLIQCVWIFGLGIMYQVVWAKGRKRFTAVGQ